MIENTNGQNGPAAIERLAYSLEEAAQALGLSYASVFRLVQRGKLRSCRVLRHHLVARKELERLLTTEMQ